MYVKISKGKRDVREFKRKTLISGRCYQKQEAATLLWVRGIMSTGPTLVYHNSNTEQCKIVIKLKLKVPRQWEGLS